MATVVNTRDTILRVASPRYVNDVYQTQIALINDVLSDIANDAKITAAERQALRKEWDEIIERYVDNSTTGLAYLDDLYPAVATFYSNGSTGYVDKLQDLATYLNNGVAYTLPALGSAPTDAPNWISNANLSSSVAQTIVSTTFRSKWRLVYAAETLLVNKATIEAGKVASWTGISDSGQSGIFFDNFNTNTLSDWIRHPIASPGTAEITRVSDANSPSSGYVMRVGNNSGNDQAWLIHNNNIPYDPNALYRVKASVRRNLGTGTVYIGIVGVAADGVTLVNIAGTNSYTNQYYVAGSTLNPSSSTFTEYVGYASGIAASPVTAAATNPSKPSGLHTNVRFIRPLVIFNYSGMAGQTDLGSFSIERVGGQIGTSQLGEESVSTAIKTTETSVVLYNNTATPVSYYNVQRYGPTITTSSATSRIFATVSGRFSITSAPSTQRMLQSSVRLLLLRTSDSAFMDASAVVEGTCMTATVANNYNSLPINVTAVFNAVPIGTYRIMLNGALYGNTLTQTPATCITHILMDNEISIIEFKA